jgi:hypothetical protein
MELHPTPNPTMALSTTTRLSTLSREITLNGQAYLVEGSPDPFCATQRIFRAWTAGDFMGRHHVITTREIPGGRGWFGLVGTELDRERYDHLEGGSAARIEAVRAALADRALEARAAILAAFPEVGGCEADGAFRSAYEIASAVVL